VLTQMSKVSFFHLIFRKERMSSSSTIGQRTRSRRSGSVITISKQLMAESLILVTFFE